MVFSSHNTLKVKNYTCSQTIRAFQINPQHTARQSDNLPNSYTQNSSFLCTAAFPAQPASHSSNKQALSLFLGAFKTDLSQSFKAHADGLGVQEHCHLVSRV
jgi:hypothetical protein